MGRVVGIDFKCKDCGSSFRNADNSFSTSETSQKISQGYDRMAEFLSSSGMKVNDEKTHSIILTTTRMRKLRDISVTVWTQGLLLVRLSCYLEHW